jgi:formamidopyrimidine-DNA glycosylase
MPELPEVEIIALRLDAALRGAEVESVRLLRRDVVKRETVSLGRRLRGRKVAGVGRHGKRLLWSFTPEATMAVHLGMTGNLLLSRRSDPLPDHTHVVIRFRGISREVRFRDPRRFGGIWLEEPSSHLRSGRFSSSLGPDALSLRIGEFRRILRRRRRIKALLLDQSAVAGLGNIYCDEALHLSRVHPLESAAELGDERVRKLLGAIRKVLREAIANGGSSLRDYRDADGSPGEYQVRHRVYGREGEPCRRCRAPIERILAASRSTHFCPRCQPIG